MTKRGSQTSPDFLGRREEGEGERGARSGVGGDGGEVQRSGN